MTLIDWGCTQKVVEDAKSRGWEAQSIRRVIASAKGSYEVTDGDRATHAQVSGAFAYRAALPSDYPTTGDFVACREEGGATVIEAVLPRRGVVSRKTAGAKSDEQLLASNVDAAFIVLALDSGRGFLPRLLERYLSIVCSNDVAPIVVLNKADLAEHPQEMTNEARKAAPGAEIHAVSALTGLGLEELKARLEPAKTFLLLGKSGSGKSTLLNALFGSQIAKTGDVREQDMKGKHTTTSREIVMMENGALLMDTPGIREAALQGHDSGIDECFADVAAYACACRFGDCTHTSEPGCAVRAAVDAGLLESDRCESYLSLKKESRYNEARSRETAGHLEKKKWKQISKIQRTYSKN